MYLIMKGMIVTSRSKFTDHELSYLKSQMLGRIATVDEKGRPRVVPTGFSLNSSNHTIELSGHNFAATRRVSDVRTHPHVAFVVDDVPNPEQWNARGVMIRGIATLHEPDEANTLPAFMSGNPWMSIQPTSIHSWGLDDESAI